MSSTDGNLICANFQYDIAHLAGWILGSKLADFLHIWPKLVLSLAQLSPSLFSILLTRSQVRISYFYNKSSWIL